MVGSKLLHRSKGKRHGHDLGLWWTFAVGLVLVAAIIVAIAQNSHHVALRYLGWHAHVSLIVVVLTTALVAVFLDEVGGLIWRGRRRSRIGRRSELAELRARQQPDEPAAAVDLATPEPEGFPSIERGS
jgi:uncharacterized integral membrane protein